MMKAVAQFFCKKNVFFTLNVIFFSIVKCVSLPLINDCIEKKIVIISVSYNNKNCYEANLKSTLNQNYKNYRIIWVDAASPDGTGELVKEYLKQHDPTKKVSLVINEKRCGSMENIYNSVHSCSDDELCVMVEGDDTLAHNNVLQIINKIYQDPNVWMTYGSFMPLNKERWNPAYWTAIPNEIIKQNDFRNYRWLSSHLRTYYAWLFKKIKKEDVLYKGEFYPAASDVAVMFPLLEMAGSHSFFVKDILYIYNDLSPIGEANVYGELVRECTSKIRSAPRYMPLEKAPIFV